MKKSRWIRFNLSKYQHHVPPSSISILLQCQMVKCLFFAGSCDFRGDSKYATVFVGFISFSASFISFISFATSTKQHLFDANQITKFRARTKASSGARKRPQVTLERAPAMQQQALRGPASRCGWCYLCCQTNIDFCTSR